MELPKRKANRLGEYSYQMPGYYFITICTKNKEKIFWQGEQYLLTHAGEIAEEYIWAITPHYPNCAVEKYVVMPNHIHMILNLGGEQCSNPSVSTVISQYKRIVSKTLNTDIWQKGFYDHVIRGEEDYQEIWQYIENNPIKWNDDCYHEE